jgi:hypothetical protein
MSPAYGMLLDGMETAARALLAQLAKTQVMDRDTVQSLQYGINRVEGLLTLSKNVLLLNGTPPMTSVTPDDVRKLAESSTSR